MGQVATETREVQVRTCPECKQVMEPGHVMGMISTASLQQFPATIGWVPESVQPSERGYSDQRQAVPFTEIVFGPLFGKRPRFVAWRCQKCRLVIFTYVEGSWVR